MSWLDDFGLRKGLREWGSCLYLAEQNWLYVWYLLEDGSGVVRVYTRAERKKMREEATPSMFFVHEG